MEASLGREVLSASEYFSYRLSSSPKRGLVLKTPSPARGLQTEAYSGLPEVACLPCGPMREAIEGCVVLFVRSFLCSFSIL